MSSNQLAITFSEGFAAAAFTIYGLNLSSLEQICGRLSLGATFEQQIVAYIGKVYDTWAQWSQTKYFIDLGCQPRGPNELKTTHLPNEEPEVMSQHEVLVAGAFAYKVATVLPTDADIFKLLGKFLPGKTMEICGGIFVSIVQTGLGLKRDWAIHPIAPHVTFSYYGVRESFLLGWETKREVLFRLFCETGLSVAVLGVMSQPGGSFCIIAMVEDVSVEHLCSCLFWVEEQVSEWVKNMPSRLALHDDAHGFRINGTPIREIIKGQGRGQGGAKSIADLNKITQDTRAGRVPMATDMYAFSVLKIPVSPVSNVDAERKLDALDQIAKLETTLMETYGWRKEDLKVGIVHYTKEPGQWYSRMSVTVLKNVRTHVYLEHVKAGRVHLMDKRVKATSASFQPTCEYE